MKKEAYNNCGLCLKPALLQASHILSDYLWQSMPKDLLMVDPKTLTEIPLKPRKEYLLCKDCEQKTGYYENYLKLILELKQPTVFAKETGHLNYDIYNVDHDAINLALTSYLYKASIAEEAFGSGNSLSSTNVRLARKSLQTRRPFKRIKVLAAYHLYSRNQSSVYERNALFLHKHFTNPSSKLGSNPLWFYMDGKFLFIIQEQANYHQNSLPEVLHANSNLRVTLGESETVLGTYMTKKAILQSRETIKSILPAAGICRLCEDHSLTNLCCKEKYLSKIKYYRFVVGNNGKIYFNQINFSSMRSDFKKLNNNIYCENDVLDKPDKVITDIILDIFPQYKNLKISGRQPVIGLNKDSNLKTFVDQIKNTLK